MFCKHCGAEIDDKAVICVHCGVATDNLNANPVNNTTNNNPGAPAKKLNVLALVGLIVSAVGMIGLNYFMLLPAIAGLVLSIIGIVKSKEYSAPGLAIAAIVVSAVSFFIWLLIWIALFDSMLFGTAESMLMSLCA